MLPFALAVLKCLSQYEARSINSAGLYDETVFMALWVWRETSGVRGRPHGLKNSGQTLFSGQAQVAQKFW